MATTPRWTAVLVVAVQLVLVLSVCSVNAEVIGLPMQVVDFQQRQATPPPTPTPNKTTAPGTGADGETTPQRQRNLQLGVFYACIGISGIAMIAGFVRIIYEAQEIQLYADRKGSRSSQIRSGSSNGSKEQHNNSGPSSQPTPTPGGGIQPSSQTLTSVAPTPNSPAAPMTPMTGPTPRA